MPWVREEYVSACSGHKGGVMLRGGWEGNDMILITCSLLAFFGAPAHVERTLDRCAG